MNLESDESNSSSSDEGSFLNDEGYERKDENGI